MIGESSERTTEPNPNRSSEAFPEGDEEEDDDDGPTIVLGNGPVEPTSVSASDKLKVVGSPMNEPSPVGADAGETEKDVLPVKNENEDVGIVEKEVIMETPVTETVMIEPVKEMDTLVAETGTAEIIKEMETPVAETVVTEVKKEMDIQVSEIGVSEQKTEESENVQK